MTTSTSARPRVERAPRRRVLALRAHRTATGVSVLVDLDDGTREDVPEGVWRRWLWTPAYGAADGVIDLWHETKAGWESLECDHFHLCARVAERIALDEPERDGGSADGAAPPFPGVSGSLRARADADPAAEE